MVGTADRSELGM
jgi:hypothetical protein